MARRRSKVDQELALLARLREEQPDDSSDKIAELLRSEAHYVASEAAVLAQELELHSLGPALAEAFRRVHDGEQHDPGCAVSRATIGALGALGIHDFSALLGSNPQLDALRRGCPLQPHRQRRAAEDDDFPLADQPRGIASSSCATGPREPLRGVVRSAH